MGQQVNRSSKVKIPSESDCLNKIILALRGENNYKRVKLLLLDTKQGDLSMVRL